MDWKCPVCGKTFKRERQAHKCFTGGGPELAFPGPKAKWLSLYLELLSRAKSRIDFEPDYPPSGGAIWRKRSIFASMHGESAGLFVNFFSGQPLPDVRIVTGISPSAHRLAYAFRLTDMEELDTILEYIVGSYVLTGQAGK
jgi:hypothetical protein